MPRREAVRPFEGTHMVELAWLDPSDSVPFLEETLTLELVYEGGPARTACRKGFDVEVYARLQTSVSPIEESATVFVHFDETTQLAPPPPGSPAELRSCEFSGTFATLGWESETAKFAAVLYGFPDRVAVTGTLTHVRSDRPESEARFPLGGPACPEP